MIGDCGEGFLRAQGGQAKAGSCRKNSRRTQCSVRASLNISSQGTAPIESHLSICIPPVDSHARGGPQTDVIRACPCLKGSSLGSDAQEPLGSKIVGAAFSSSRLRADSRHPRGRTSPPSDECSLYIRCASFLAQLQTQDLPTCGQLFFLRICTPQSLSSRSWLLSRRLLNPRPSYLHRESLQLRRPSTRCICRGGTLYRRSLSPAVPSSWSAANKCSRFPSSPRASRRFFPVTLLLFHCRRWVRWLA